MAGRPPDPNALRHTGKRLSPVDVETADLVKAIALEWGIPQAKVIKIAIKAIANTSKPQ